VTTACIPVPSAITHAYAIKPQAESVHIAVVQG